MRVYLQCNTFTKVFYKEVSGVRAPLREGGCLLCVVANLCSLLAHLRPAAHCSAMNYHVLDCGLPLHRDASIMRFISTPLVDTFVEDVSMNHSVHCLFTTQRFIIPWLLIGQHLWHTHQKSVCTFKHLSVTRLSVETWEQSHTHTLSQHLLTAKYLQVYFPCMHFWRLILFSFQVCRFCFVVVFFSFSFQIVTCTCDCLCHLTIRNIFRNVHAGSLFLPSQKHTFGKCYKILTCFTWLN